MAWFVQALKKKAADGLGAGIWHLTAKSDEDGGFAVGCEHDHTSVDEAQQCLEARRNLGSVTGFPLQMDKITINGVEHDWPHDDLLSHDNICKLAGQPLHASVAYHVYLEGDAERSGTTYAGKSIKSADGMHITCVVTGNA